MSKTEIQRLVKIEMMTLLKDLLKLIYCTGLKMHLLINQSEYVDWADVAGVKIFMSDRGTPISADFPSVNVQPGDVTTIFVSMVRFHFT